VSGVSKVVSENYAIQFTLVSSIDSYKARLSGIAKKYNDWQLDKIQTEYGVWVSADEYINLYRQEEQLKRKVAEQIRATMKTMETLSSAFNVF
jgi:wyosine [tRNA(Phe)-imidazoG37] synthetase (radical SAM superfamily)